MVGGLSRGRGSLLLLVSSLSFSTTMKDSDLGRHSTHSIIGGEERIRCDATTRLYKVIRVLIG